MINKITTKIIILLYLKRAYSGVLNGAFMPSAGKPFIVYISRGLNNESDGLICEGAIIKPKYILTTASCVDTTITLHVVAGMQTLVLPKLWAGHQCISKRKKKIVRISKPIEFYTKKKILRTWQPPDVAVAEVDTPYDFLDITYRFHCDYIPKPIRINYEYKYQSENTTAFIYKWPDAFTTNQSVVMHYANISIISKAECTKSVQLSKNIICTKFDQSHDLNFDFFDTDEAISLDSIEHKGIGSKMDYNENSKRNENGFSDDDYDFTHINGRQFVRSGEPCQHYHGAPLTTFEGGEEILIGVGVGGTTSDDDERCQETNQFISTYSLSLFLKCVLKESDLLVSYHRLCLELTKEGYYIEEIDKNISSKVPSKKIRKKNIYRVRATKELTNYQSNKKLIGHVVNTGAPIV
ncbi:uncharacterized protein LOC128680310 isoform X2 [Plodia interpunctella]|uniref:uncharacterized protein LOC128680310 isoform X2 n=1 Tax=Plodia interpunctella TaxID=58824 RepID=UPI002367685A|nr:uncharacterized protein LOC128680310 isoform X2 [Plodia interpunctella]